MKTRPLLVSYEAGLWCVQSSPSLPKVTIPEALDALSTSIDRIRHIVIAVPEAWVTFYQEEVDLAYNDEMCYIAAATFASEVCAVAMDSVLFRYTLDKMKKSSPPVLSIEAVALEQLEEPLSLLEPFTSKLKFVLGSDVCTLQSLDLRVKRDSKRFLTRYSLVNRNIEQWKKVGIRFVITSVVSHVLLASFFLFLKDTAPKLHGYDALWSNSKSPRNSISVSVYKSLKAVKEIPAPIRLDSFHWSQSDVEFKLTGRKADLDLLEAVWRERFEEPLIEFSSSPKRNIFHDSKVKEGELREMAITLH